MKMNRSKPISIIRVEKADETDQIHTVADHELLNSDKKAPRFSLAGLTVSAKCVDVYDGDTAQFNFRIPWGSIGRCGNAHDDIIAGSVSGVIRYSCRFLDYNCAEIKTKDPAEKEAAVIARDVLRGKILGKMVTLRLGEFDKYGRPLVHVLCGGEDINKYMLDSGYGKPYCGAGEKQW
jgi:endonuclease YncB( thermonuclease family)